METQPAETQALAQTALSRLSESWTVAERHIGCYTGGKIAWSESAQILGCIYNEELQLVDANTKEPQRRIAHEGDGILTFAIDPSGSNACTSHRSGLLRHWRLQEIGNSTKLEAVRAWRAHEQIVADVSFDASGSLVASGSIDRTVRVWDFTGYFCTHNFKGHTSLVSIVRFHPGKLQLVSVADVEVRLWDLQTSSCIAIMKDHLSSVSSISFARIKGTTYHLLTSGRDQVVNVWSLEGKCSIARSLPLFENVEGVTAVPTKGLRQACAQMKDTSDTFLKWLQGVAEMPHYLVLTVGDKSLLRVWNPLDGKCVRSQKSPHAAKGLFRHIACLDQSSGRKIVTVGEDMNLIIWSLPEFTVINYIMGHNEELVHVQLIPQLSWPDSTTSDVAPATKSGVRVKAERFVAIANDEHPRIVNCHGFGASLLHGHTDVVIACDVSADGSWIVTGGKDQTIRIWSANDCRCACVLAGHAGAISALSFPKKRPKSPPSSSGIVVQPLFVVSGSHDKTMKVWELPKVEKMMEVVQNRLAEPKVEKAKVTVVAHSKEVNDVVVSPNNKLIASGGHDKLIRIWKFPDADLVGECKGHRRGIWCVVFHPTDQVIASASGDTTVRLWNLKDFTAIKAFEGHSSAVLRVCFLSNGMQLMTSGVDGLLKLWQIRTAECAATFEEHTGKVWCVDVLGDCMVSGGSDSKLCVWKDSTELEARNRHDEKAELAMKDSKIGLLVQDGNIEEALSLALDLNRPGQMKKILTDYAMAAAGKEIVKVTEQETPAQDASSSSSVNLHHWVSSMSDARLEKLVAVLESWNSNRKMASLAHMLMSLVLKTVLPSKLAKLEGMNATCDAFLSYSSRHMARVESLLQKTYLFDLVLQSSSQGLALEDPAGKDGEETSLVRGASAEAALKSTMAVLLGSGDDEESDVEVGHTSTNGARVTIPKAEPTVHSKAFPGVLLMEDSTDEEGEDSVPVEKSLPRKRRKSVNGSSGGASDRPKLKKSRA